MNALIHPRHKCIFSLLLIVNAWAVARAAETDRGVESRGHVVTAGGSLIQCLISHPAPWTIAAAGGIQTLKFDTIASIALSERIDPNIENEASVAVGDLQSENFETRAKAEAQLRGLGRAAARPLKQALALPDAGVVKSARTLLREMGALEEDGLSQDRVQLRDGTLLRGELTLTDLAVRSRFGRLRIPMEMLEKISFDPPNEHTKQPEARASFASMDSKEIVLPLPPAERAAGPSAQRWDPLEDARNDAAVMQSWLIEAQRNALTMDKIALKKSAPGEPAAKAETKAGDRLEDAYAERGVLLRATETGTPVEVSNEMLQSFSAGRCLTANKSDLEVRFFLPKDRADGRDQEPAGVLHAGAVVRTNGPGTVGIEAYDSRGRLLGIVLNNDSPATQGLPGQREQFLGVQSKTPIARLRIFRSGALKQANAELLLDDLIFDRIFAAGLGDGLSRVSLTAGDRITGTAVDAEDGAIAMKAEFLGEPAAPLLFKLAEISRYEPARGIETIEAGAQAKDGAAVPRHFGVPHGILLQSGETFRARLFSLDDQSAVFRLAGGAWLKLPRQALRKVELLRGNSGDSEGTPPTVLGKDEKPGVEFKTKPQGDNPAAPQLTDEKKSAALNPAQGLPRMDNAEIVNIDPHTREITVKDEYGEMTMNLAGIKALVFPPDAGPAPTAKKRGWSLTLREGSRFDADVEKITPKEITVQMAGGIVVLPTGSVENLERK